MRSLTFVLLVGCEPQQTGLTEDDYWAQERVAGCEAAVHCPDTEWYGKPVNECLAAPYTSPQEQVEAGFLVCYDSGIACDCLEALRAIGPDCVSLRDEWPDVCYEVYQQAALIYDNQIEARCDFEDE